LPVIGCLEDEAKKFIAEVELKISGTFKSRDSNLNLLAPELFFLILAHPVNKM